MPDLELPKSRIIKCPYCGLIIDLSIHKPHKDVRGNYFISCPRPGRVKYMADKSKPACGQYIALDTKMHVITSK